MADQKPASSGPLKKEGKPALDKKPHPKAPAPSGITLPSLAVSSRMIFMISVIGILGVLAVKFTALWKTLSILVSMAAIAVLVYAYMRLLEIAKAETEKIGHMPTWSSEKEKKNARWEAVEKYMRSNNPSDWKVAIMEADNMLDEVVKRMGYHGDTLGERMKNIEASDFPYLDEVWQAHKTRNRIAHTGTDFPISRSTAEDTVNIYYRTFKELGYL